MNVIRRISSVNTYLMNSSTIYTPFLYIFTFILFFTVYKPALSLELRTYYIDCDSSEFADILARPWERRYIDCTFQYGRTVWRDVRFRVRGESSLGYPKKSFKINFDADDRFYSRDKIILVSEWEDASFSREFLSYDFYHRAGLPASRTWFTRIYINNRYMGLYLDIEEIDEHYLASTDFEDDASIYKADGNGCLLRPSDRVDLNWDKVTNEDAGYYELHRLIEWLDTVVDERFFGELSDYFQPEELARVIAVNGILANTSTYYHNYFLIHEPDADGRWHMLPWDMDYTFHYRYNYGTPSFSECGLAQLGTNSLIVHCWRDTSMRAIIYEQMRGLIDSVFVENYFQAMSDTLEELLMEAVDADTFKQYTTEHFIDEINDFPAITGGRGRRIIQKMEEYPFPFDLRTAVLSPEGIYLSWEPTATPDSNGLSYTVLISSEIKFPSDNRLVIADIEETNILYDQIQTGHFFWRVYASTDNDGHKTYSLSYNSPFEIPENAFNPTIVSGTIESSTNWSIENSPYSLPDGLTVAPDAVLTIEPGVVVGIGNWENIRIEGGLTVTGSFNDSVRFVPLNPASHWGTIEVIDATDPVILNYTVVTGGYYFLVVNGGERLDIYDSSFRRGRRAIETFYCPVHIERVRFEDFSEEVLAVRNANAVVRSCRFSHGPQSQQSADLADFDDISELEIDRCLFYAGVDEAIDMDRVDEGKIVNCRISGARDKGISIGGYDCNIYVANNIISNCQTGIGLTAHSGIRLFNNVIAFNDTGICVGSYHEYEGNVYARNTVLWRNDVEICLERDAQLDIAYSMVRGDDYYPGEGNHRRNAHFIDQWNRNFELRADSPLIDAGYGTDHPELDYYEAPRVDVPQKENSGGGRLPYVDIGAFEYGSTGRIPEDEPALPKSHFLLTNFPNPFNSTTKIEFRVIEYSPVNIEISDISGRRVYRRDFKRAKPGLHAILWDGRNDMGESLASGVYICRVSQQVGAHSIKLVLVK
ncbi:CotH kinase family protein [bacterium]|nr:CotH kinase family protein [bacterium]